MESAPKDISKLINTAFLYQQAPCGHLSFDTDGKIYRVNQTFLSWTGLTEEECLQRPFTSLLTTGGVLYYQMVVTSLLYLHGLGNEINFTFNSEKGKFDALFNAVAYKNESGQVMMINATIQKITDRKKYEAELLRAKREAEENHYLLTNNLSTAQQTIEQNKGQFSRIAFSQSHMIRKPLANIMGLVPLLDAESLTAEGTLVLKLLKESAGELDTLITDIVAQTKI